MINTLFTLAAVVAGYAIAAPVIQSCTIPSNLYAYCDRSVSDTELNNGVQLLYEESDDMIDLLETVCNKTVRVVVLYVAYDLYTYFRHVAMNVIYHYKH